MKPVPYYVLAFAMAVPAILVGIEIPSWLFLASPTLALQSDFRVFYTPGYMVRTRQADDIYNFSAVRRNQAERVAPDGGAVPFLHPAYETVLFVPLSYLSYRTAYLVFAAINFAVLGSIYRLLRARLVGLSHLGPVWLIPALLIGFTPIAFAIFAGQDSLFLLLVLVLAFHRLAVNEFQAGLLLGLGTFRFQVLLTIVVLFMLWRGWRLVAGWIVSSATMLCASVAITGTAAQAQYIRLLLQMGSLSYWPMLRRMPNIRALFTAFGLGALPVVLLSVMIFLVVAVVGNKHNSGQRLLLAVTTCGLVTYYLFLHDLSVLALPIFASMDDAACARNWSRLALISAVLPLFAILWFARDHFYVGALFTSIFLIIQTMGLMKRT
jgi:glycosyl transferase family 87